MGGEVLRDDQWERLKPFVPGGRKGRRGPRSNGRRFLDALLWLVRSGGRRRDLPEDRFGPYRTVPELKAGDVVIFDDLSSRKGAEAQALVEACGLASQLESWRRLPALAPEGA